MAKTAQLEICPMCKLHGHIVLSDGTKGEEFSCKMTAIREVFRLIGVRKISSQEGEALDPIWESTLANDPFEATTRLPTMLAVHTNDERINVIFGGEGLLKKSGPSDKIH